MDWAIFHPRTCHTVMWILVYFYAYLPSPTQSFSYIMHNAGWDTDPQLTGCSPLLSTPKVLLGPSTTFLTMCWYFSQITSQESPLPGHLHELKKFLKSHEVCSSFKNTKESWKYGRLNVGALGFGQIHRWLQMISTEAGKKWFRGASLSSPGATVLGGIFWLEISSLKTYQLKQ